jgi:hypothetical protein
MSAAVVHSSPFSGAWYPDSAAELKQILDRACDLSALRIGSAVRPGGIAFIVPHAAPIYSGPIAAAAYRHAAVCRPRRIILLGFSHHGGVSGIAIPDVGAISTPLGDVILDAHTIHALARHNPFRILPESALCDHSIEIQLPFIQRAMPDALVTPLYVGRLHPGERLSAAASLRGVLSGAAILIASSDFTHYGHAFGYTPFPLNEETPYRLRGLDEGVIAAAASLDPDALLAELRRTGSNTCGYQPIALLLETLSAENISQQTLDYQTSGELTGDYSLSVSYAALGYFVGQAPGLRRPPRPPGQN